MTELAVTTVVGLGGFAVGLVFAGCYFALKHLEEGSLRGAIRAVLARG